MVERLRARYGLAVYFEPGAALVRQAGSLVTEVIDLFRSDGETIAVLDTTVNHVPEVFEYQFEPDLEEHTRNGRYSAFLVGSSCLAGDVLGRYAFDQPLKIGSRLVLRNLGAYSLVKSHMFNGINLPNIYAIDSGGALSLRRSFDYGDYLTHSGAKLDATI
jgi:carboxynorspermidine decarboxylase